MRIRRRGALRALAAALACGLAAKALPALLEPPQPPPLAADVGLPNAARRAVPPSLERPSAPAVLVRVGPGRPVETARAARPRHDHAARPLQPPRKRRKDPGEPAPAPAPPPPPLPVAPAPPPAVVVPPAVPAPSPPSQPPDPPGDGSQEFAPR
jgi:hypothetical protein